MSAGKVRSARMKVYPPPAGVKADEQFHVYVFDVFNEKFLPGKTLDNIERAAQFQRHQQEHIYTVQEAEPELFDLPFISSDPGLITRVERDPEYRRVLVRDLGSEARGRNRRR